MKRLVGLCALFLLLTSASSRAAVLAQSNPAVTTLTTIYTVPVGPANTTAQVQVIVVANRDSSAHTFRLSVASGCASDNVKQYLYYDVSIPANSSFVQAVNLPLSGGDCVRGYVDAQQESFTLFGVTSPYQ